MEQYIVFHAVFIVQKDKSKCVYPEHYHRGAPESEEALC